MATVESRWGTGANAEAIQAWDGPLFDRFLQFRHVVTTGLGAHGDEALRLYPPQPGWRVLDVGCGFGDTTQRIAELVGLEGEALGVDAAANFIRMATTESSAPNTRFEVADVQTHTWDAPFDMAFSRMGTMFFANPVAALRNVREALVPGGRLVMVVWRRREDNEWVHRAQQIVEGIVQRPDEYDDPTCGPGPFSLSGADTTTDILRHAGFAEPVLHRCDLPIMIGRDLDEAVEFVMALGPAGEILRLQGERAAHLLGRVNEALREGLSEYVRGDGVWAPASTWVVAASAPA